MNRGILILAITLAATCSTEAAAVDGRTVFLGADVGASKVDVSVEGLGSDSDADRSFQLRGGYYFNSNFALEAFHANIYDVSEEGYSADLDGIGLGLVGRKNFGADNNGFYVAGRAGVFNAKGSASEEGVGSVSGRSSKPYFGVGLGYDFSHHVGLGVNYTFFKGDFDELSVDANMLTLGLEARF